MFDPILASELVTMAEEDQALRGAEDSDASSAAETQRREADVRHLARLREIVDEVGWPGESLVGQDGADAAWLLAQHARLDSVGLQRSWLELIRRAVALGEADVLHFVFLADRTALGDGLATTGRPGTQPYGTHSGSVTTDDGEDIELPVSPAVHENRAALGLMSLTDYKAAVEAHGGYLFPYRAARHGLDSYQWRSGIVIPDPR